MSVTYSYAYVYSLTYLCFKMSSHAQRLVSSQLHTLWLTQRVHCVWGLWFCNHWESEVRREVLRCCMLWFWLVFCLSLSKHESFEMSVERIYGFCCIVYPVNPVECLAKSLVGEMTKEMLLEICCRSVIIYSYFEPCLLAFFHFILVSFCVFIFYFLHKDFARGWLHHCITKCPT